MSRRRIPATSRPTPIPSFQAQNASLNNEYAEPVIKHVQFIQTNFSQKHEIANEFIIFIFTAIAASSQFVHLYRSVWWFQDSYTNYTVVSVLRNLWSLTFDELVPFTELLSHRFLPLGIYIRDDWPTILLLFARENP